MEAIKGECASPEIHSITLHIACSALIIGLRKQKGEEMLDSFTNSGWFWFIIGVGVTLVIDLKH